MASDRVHGMSFLGHVHRSAPFAATACSNVTSSRLRLRLRCPLSRVAATSSNSSGRSTAWGSSWASQRPKKRRSKTDMPKQEPAVQLHQQKPGQEVTQPPGLSFRDFDPHHWFDSTFLGLRREYRLVATFIKGVFIDFALKQPEDFALKQPEDTFPGNNNPQFRRMCGMCTQVSLLLFDAIKEVDPAEDVEVCLGYLYYPPINMAFRHVFVKLAGQNVDLALEMSKQLASKVYGLDPATSCFGVAVEQLPPGAEDMGWEVAGGQLSGPTPEQHAADRVTLCSAAGRAKFWDRAPQPWVEYRKVLIGIAQKIRDSS